jgi:hypothetical protein
MMKKNTIAANHPIKRRSLMNQKTLIILGAGCAIACLALTALLAIGGYALFNAVSEPEDISTTVTAPTSARIGEKIEISVIIANQSSQSRELNSIDIYTSYLDGILIEGTQPAYSSFSNFNDFHTYYFERNLSPNETLSITFFGEAIKTGDFSGDLDTCIDSEISCTTDFLRIIIRE